jgi:hypothetical protein
MQQTLKNDVQKVHGKTRVRIKNIQEGDEPHCVIRRSEKCLVNSSTL